MARGKKDPDYKNIGLNPFANELAIKVNKKITDVINKFGNPDTLEKDLEGSRYLKLYEVKGFKSNMMKLNMRAKEMLLYILHSLDNVCDYIYLERDSYMKEHEISSINTYKKAIKDLCDTNYIYKHHSPEFKDVYWTNPHYFFKGDRLKKYPAKIRYTTGKEKSED